MELVVVVVEVVGNVVDGLEVREYRRGSVVVKI